MTDHLIIYSDRSLSIQNSLGPQTKDKHLLYAGCPLWAWDTVQANQLNSTTERVGDRKSFMSSEICLSNCQLMEQKMITSKQSAFVLGEKDL